MIHLKQMIPYALGRYKTLWLACCLLLANLQLRAQCTSTFTESLDSMANTGIIAGISTSAVNIFPHPYDTNGHFFVTSLKNDSTVISYFDRSGTLLWADMFRYNSLANQVQDMYIDSLSGDIVAIANFGLQGSIFRYRIATHSIVWMNGTSVSSGYENIHRFNDSLAIITATINSMTQLFMININTGLTAVSGYNLQGEGGEYYSTLKDGILYGASRRYWNPLNDFRTSLFAHNAATGAFLWQKSLITSGNTRMYPVAPVKDSNNLLMLASGDMSGFNVYNNGPVELALVNTNDTGNVIWTRQYIANNPLFNRPNATAIKNTAGGYFLVGNYYRAAPWNDFTRGFVIKTDKQGNVIWARQMGDTLRNKINNVMEMKDGLCIAMSSQTTSGWDLVLMKIDSNGNSSCGLIDTLNITVVNLPRVSNDRVYTGTSRPFAINSYTAVTKSIVPVITTLCATCCHDNDIVINTNRINAKYCIRDTVRFSDSVNGVLNPGGAYTYRWYYKNAVTPWTRIGAANGDTTATPWLVPTVPGTDTIRLVVGSLNGTCLDTVLKTIRVYDTAGSTLVMAACDSFVWNGQAYNIGGHYIRHYLNGGGCDSQANLMLTIKSRSYSVITDSACSNYVFNGSVYAAPGTYYQHYTNSAGCDSTVELRLIHRPVTASFVTADTMCVHAAVYLVNTSTADPGSSYTWYVNGGGLAYTGYTPNIPIHSAGMHMITLRVQSGSCIDTIARNIYAQNCCIDSVAAGLSNGLIAYYTFTSGQTNDVSGHGHNATIVGTGVNVMGDMYNAHCALHFPGTATAYLSVPSHPDFDLAFHSSSFSIWYHPEINHVNKYELLTGRSNGNGNVFCDTWGAYSLGLYDCRRPVLGINGNHCWEGYGMSAMPPGWDCQDLADYYVNRGWQHIVGTYDYTAGVLSVYWNGHLSSSLSGTTCPSPAINMTDLIMGSNFQGGLDDIRVYNRAITSAEAAQLYAMGASHCCDKVGVEPVNNLVDAYRIVPNPAGDFIRINNGKAANLSVQITNMMGQTVLVQQVKTDEPINVSRLSSGIYMIRETVSGALIGKLQKN